VPLRTRAAPPLEARWAARMGRCRCSARF